MLSCSYLGVYHKSVDACLLDHYLHQADVSDLGIIISLTITKLIE